MIPDIHKTVIVTGARSRLRHLRREQWKGFGAGDGTNSLVSRLLWRRSEWSANGTALCQKGIKRGSV